MTDRSQPIDPELKESLLARSDEDLISIFEKPDDWRPEVVDFARSELTRRSISPEQIKEKVAETAKQKAEELQQRSNVPLSFWEVFQIVLYGFLCGLLGLLFVWIRSSRFKSKGYICKANQSWLLYWFSFGGRIVCFFIIFILVLRTSH